MTITCVILSTPKVPKLARAVQSVLWCDEVLLVLDGEKRDLSANIVSSSKVKVILSKMTNDFASQRNVGLAQAQGDWVLFLDSDEVITTDLLSEIQRSIQNTDANGYFLHRQDVFMGKTLHHGETGTISLLRLAKKDTGVWVRPVHEIWKVQGKIERLNNPILHTPHATISAFFDKINAYTSIEANHRKVHGKKFSIIELLIFPTAKFIQNYVLKLGFLDGFPGFVMAYMMSLHSLIVRVKMYENHH